MAAAIALVAALGSSAAAQSPSLADPVSTLRAADAAGAAGDWTATAALVGTLDLSRLDRGDLAEARRLRGLADFFAGRRADAEVELVEWLKLDQDAHLDPGVTPPEAVSFFEEVRGRHAAELRALRPQPRRWAALNLLPPWGQFQNGDRGKGWVIAGAGVALLAVDVGSYALLRHWCSSSDLTCDVGSDRAGEARNARTVNLIAGGALIALYAYGAIDGFWGYRSHTEVRVLPMLSPDGAGAQVVLGGRF